MTEQAIGTRRRRAPGAVFAVGAVIALGGCSASIGDGSSLSSWSASISTRWQAFVDVVLVPVGDALLAMLVAWLVLAVGARLVALLPGVRNLAIRRRTGAVLRRIGWVLVGVTPIVIVIATAYASDGFAAWLVVALPLALVAVAVLGPGLASRSRLDAKVMDSDGSVNTAWSIDALNQVRNANLDDPAERVERPSTPDLGEFIAIADRSGSGIASAIAWLFQVLFNSAPWMLQVTVLDERSGIATLRRNGHPVDEVELGLEWESAQPDQHRKLLALAAGFTAMTMAERYPDVRGFYRAKGWRSVGFLGLARMTTDDEHRHYLNRAIEEDPTSILAEYDRVFDRVDGLDDRAAHEAFLDRIEPIVNQAAWLCGEPQVFDDVPPKVWHAYVRTAAEVGGERLDPSDVRRAFRPVRTRLDARRRARPTAPEPQAMLLRSLMAYLTAARNWSAFVDLAEGRAGSGTTGEGAAADEIADAAKRRERIRDAVVRYLALLERQTGGPRRDPNRVLARMRARAALSYVIFTPGVADEWAAADAAGSAASRGSSRLPAKQEVEARAAAAARRWMEDANGSLEVEIRYSCACFTARRALAAAAPEEHDALVAEAIRGIRYARQVDFYQREAARDPELMLLGGEPRMRELVIAPISSPWQIARFAAVRERLEQRGIFDPARIADAPGLLGLDDALGLGAEDFAMLVDASEILKTGMATDEGCLTDTERLRAVRFLVDGADFSIRALAGHFSQGFDELIRSVARAVHWVPTAEEFEDIARFMVGLLTHLNVAAFVEQPAPPPAAAAAPKPEAPQVPAHLSGGAYGSFAS
ncbi:hypothetical protein [Agromyces sp. CCNWLW203]|uniref:hypothetical protein n=1 Tax=Agromyces sp. CCNWLW203 TaxID=3112842 RepID=UPI002F9654F1